MNRSIERDRQKEAAHRVSVAISKLTIERLYRDECRVGRTEFPNLLGIHECSPHVYTMPETKLHARFGYDGLVHLKWTIESEDYLRHAQGRGNFAGHVSEFEGDRTGPVVFVMKPPMRQNPNLRWGMMLVVLAHELGHVHDITHQVHLKRGGPVDISAAEEFAHRCACRRFIAIGNRLPALCRSLLPEVTDELLEQWLVRAMAFPRLLMAMYICQALPAYAKLPHESVRSAAIRVLESEDIKEFREFAASQVQYFSD